MISQGKKSVDESRYLKKKGEKILSEKLPEIKKIKTRIVEGEKITKEGKVTKKWGETLKKSGSKLVTPTKRLNEPKEC